MVSTWCSTNSALRVSVKHAANRSVSRIARSVWPSNKAPASEVIAPPSKPAITWRLSTGGNSNKAGLHSVGIGASYGIVITARQREGIRFHGQIYIGQRQLVRFFAVFHQHHQNRPVGEI